MLKNMLLVLAVAAIGLALARPQWGETTEVSQALGEDILFVLDCSKSMLATDVQPSRLGRAKFAILDFVQRHGRGRVGLVAFAGQAFLQCPLTFDYDAFREACWPWMKNHSRAGHGHRARAGRGYRAMEKNDRRKFLVLVTDGEDLEKSGVKTAQALAEKGIVVYAIGVGTAAGSPIRIVNEQRRDRFLRDPDGRRRQSHLDEATLTAIAAGHTWQLSSARRAGRRLEPGAETGGNLRAPSPASPRRANWAWTGFIFPSQPSFFSSCLNPSSAREKERSEFKSRSGVRQSTALWH